YLRKRDWHVVGVDSLLTGSAGNLGHRAGDSGFRFLRQDVTKPFVVDDPVDLVLHYASPASQRDYLRHPIHTLHVDRVGGLDARIVRIFNTYGPRMRAGDGRAIPQFITHALSGVPLPVHGDGRQTRSFCFVEDLVEGIYRLATYDGLAGEVFNLGNPEEVTLLELAETVASLVGTPLNLVHLPLPQDDPARR